MTDRAALGEARDKLDLAERSEWIEKIVLTGDEARALRAEIIALEDRHAHVGFGLRAQGHFDTVMQMRKDGRSWEEIGQEIGWTPEAVERFYENEKL